MGSLPRACHPRSNPRVAGGPYQWVSLPGYAPFTIRHSTNMLSSVMRSKDALRDFAKIRYGRRKPEEQEQADVLETGVLSPSYHRPQRLRHQKCRRRQLDGRHSLLRIQEDNSFFREESMADTILPSLSGESGPEGTIMERLNAVNSRIKRSELLSGRGIVYEYSTEARQRSLGSEHPDTCPQYVIMQTATAI